MLLLLKFILISSLFLVSYQDLKDRLVSVFLFIVIGLILGYFHLINVSSTQYWISVLINTLFITMILIILKMYSRIKLRKTLKESFGLGDVLFFFAMAIGFSTITFLVLFSFSLIFSFILFFLTKKKQKYDTVPLAGFQALFLSIILLVNWTFHFINFYTI